MYLPHVLMNAKTSKLLMSVYFEKYFETDLDDFRKQLGIIPLKEHKH